MTANFSPMTANLYYPDVAGEPNGYRIRAVEVAPDLFNVYVENIREGYRANGAFGRVVDAEKWIEQDRARQAGQQNYCPRCGLAGVVVGLDSVLLETVPEIRRHSC